MFITARPVADAARPKITAVFALNCVFQHCVSFPSLNRLLCNLCCNSLVVALLVFDGSYRFYGDNVL